MMNGLGGLGGLIGAKQKRGGRANIEWCQIVSDDYTYSDSQKTDF